MPLYFISTLVYFWIPAAVMGALVLPRLDRLGARAFWLTIAAMVPVTVVMEYVYLYFDIWSFSEAKDPLLGLWIFGAPVEEFSFWLGGPPFVLLAYLGFCRLLERRHA